MIKNKFAKWIEWLLDLLPLFAVLFSCLYVTFNNNAMQSYYGDTINERQYESITSLHNGYEYNFNTNNSTDFSYTDPTRFVIQWKDNVTTTYAQAQTLLTALNENDTITIEFNSFNNILQLRFYYGNSTSSSDRFTIVDLSTYSLSFDFYLTSFTSNNYNRFIEKITYNNYSYLSNSFTYALSQFNDLGFDKLNFTNWFIDLFTQGNNNVYTTFINGYLNYFLLVECTYVLPMVLYWFIHLGERLINKLEDVGGIDK